MIDVKSAMNTYTPMPDFTAPSRFLLFFAAGILIAAVLDLYVDLGVCQYDACRYITIGFGGSFLGDEDFLGIVGTALMHYIYSDLFFVSGFLGAFILNFSMLLLTYYFVGFDDRWLGHPLIFAFTVLPGKEFFVLLGGMVFIYAVICKATVRGYVVKAAFGLALVALARPFFVPLILITYCLSLGFVVSLRWLHFGLLCAAVAVFLAAIRVFLFPVDAEHPALELNASIPGVTDFRGGTFGYSIGDVSARIFTYFVYLTFLPIAEFLRSGYDLIGRGLNPAHIYTFSACLQFFFWYVSSVRGVVIRCFVVCAVLIGCVYPFIHTRYLLPLALLFVFCHSLRSKQGA